MNLNFIKGLKGVSENRTDTPFFIPETERRCLIADFNSL